MSDDIDCIRAAELRLEAAARFDNGMAVQMSQYSNQDVLNAVSDIAWLCDELERARPVGSVQQRKEQQ